MTAGAQVRVIGWDNESAVAVVDGTKVRVRRKRHHVNWVCDAHGTGTYPHCLHLEALGKTAPPSPQGGTPEATQGTGPLGRALAGAEGSDLPETRGLDEQFAALPVEIQSRLFRVLDVIAGMGTKEKAEAWQALGWLSSSEMRWEPGAVLRPLLEANSHLIRQVGSAAGGGKD